MIRSFFLQKPPLTGTAIAVKIISAARFFSSSRVSVPGVSEEDEVAARKWLANYNSDTIPQRMCDVSFSRSSGPGGQNVNKWVLLNKPIVQVELVSDSAQNK